MFNSLTSNTEASTNKMWRAGLLVILLSGGILGQRLDCHLQDVLMKCKDTRNGRYNYFNHASVFDTSNQEDCKPCCKDPNTSITKCLETDLPDEDGVSNDQPRETDLPDEDGELVQFYTCPDMADRYVNLRSVPVQCTVYNVGYIFNFVQVYAKDWFHGVLLVHHRRWQFPKILS